MTYDGEFKGLKNEENPDGENPVDGVPADAGGSDNVLYEQIVYDYTEEMEKQKKSELLIHGKEDEVELEKSKKKHSLFGTGFDLDREPRDPDEPDKIDGFFHGLFDFFDACFRGMLGLEDDPQKAERKAERQSKKELNQEKQI